MGIEQDTARQFPLDGFPEVDGGIEKVHVGIRFCPRDAERVGEHVRGLVRLPDLLQHLAPHFPVFGGVGEI